MKLADLFRPGVDPGRDPSVGAALRRAGPRTRHRRNTAWQLSVQPGALDTGQGLPRRLRAWALTPDELILYMPDYPVVATPDDYTRGRMQWAMDGGTVQAHIPLRC